MKQKIRTKSYALFAAFFMAALVLFGPTSSQAWLTNAAFWPVHTLQVIAGNLGGGGFATGTGTNARLDSPTAVTLDSLGNLFVVDSYYQVVREITPAGVLTAAYGTSLSNQNSLYGPFGASLDPSTGNLYIANQWGGDILKITSAGVASTLSSSVSFPYGVAYDSFSGNLFVVDESNVVKKITSTGTTTVFAGSGALGHNNATGTSATFGMPYGIAADGNGNLYIAEYYNCMIRKVTSAGVVTTLAGQTTCGSANGTGTAAQFNRPLGVAADGAGNVYVADTGNHMIRAISSTGVVTTLAGSATSAGGTDGTGTAALFQSPTGIIVNKTTNTIYVTDTVNGNVRQITTAGVVTTLAGKAPVLGSTNGTRSAASFNAPLRLTSARDGMGTLYVLDSGNCMVRKITSGGVVTTLAGSGTCTTSPVNGTGTAASFEGFATDGIAVDSSGNVYVSDYHAIRKITPTGVVTTFAGTIGTHGSANGLGSSASFYYPMGLAIDSSNRLYVADSGNCLIRVITPGGIVATFAGTGTCGTAADGTGTAAVFSYPMALTVDTKHSNMIYLVDSSVIRSINSSGVVTTIVGNGSYGYTDATGTAASFGSLSDIAVDASSNIYVADSGNRAIRKISPALVVTTVNGGSSTEAKAYLGKLPQTMNLVNGIAVDGDNVYFTTENAVLQVIEP